MATFTNQATLSYNGIVANSNTVTGELLETLTASKTAVRAQYSPGDDLTYVITLVNSGATALNELTVSDNLGAYTLGQSTYTPLTYAAGSIRYYVNGVLQTAPAVTAGPPMTITGISVPAGGNAALIYEARPNRFAPPSVGGAILNTATITGAGLTTPVTAEETVAVQNEPALSISKSLTPTAVAENGQITYTFVIENTGNTAADAADAVALTDTFTPLLKNIAVSFNGTAWQAGTQYNYGAASGNFATVAGQITVPAATYTQSALTGEWTITPGVSTLTVTGTL